MSRALVALLTSLVLACEPTDPPDDAAMLSPDGEAASTAQGWERCATDEDCPTSWADVCPEHDPIPGLSCAPGARCHYCRESTALDTQIEATCESGVWQTLRAFCDPSGSPRESGRE